jgi:photosystem II stability/assembly factor-like uncharacterized protein
VVVGAIKIADDPAQVTAQSFGVVPGEQILAHLDLLRVFGFFATLIAAMAVLVIAVKGLLRDVRRKGEMATELERLCLTTVSMGNLAAAGVAYSVGVQVQNWYNSTGAINEPERNWQATGLGLTFLCVFALGAVIVRRTPWRLLLRRLLLALGICGLIFAGQVAVQQASLGSYGYYPGRFNGDSIPPFAIPLTAGFWTVSVRQHPASDVAAFVSCGSPNDCVLFGSGFGHMTYNPGGEVTVTTDGGATWHSWLLAGPFDETEPFYMYPICSSDECVGPTLLPGADGLGIFHLKIANDGVPSITLSRNGLIDASGPSSISSCPTETWCAGMDQGTYEARGPTTTQPALLTTSDGGYTWSAHALPSAIVPEGDSLQEVPFTSCPASGHCVVAATIARYGRNLSPRAVQVRGSSFIAVTTDGGIHWSIAATPKIATDVTQLTCPDAEHCFAIVATNYSSSSSKPPPAELLSTDDAGERWHQVTTRLHWAGLGGHFICGDANHCLILAGPEILYTSDGGETWKEASIPSQSGGQQLNISGGACATTMFCVANADVSSPQSGLRRLMPVVLVTHDGGVTWTQQALPVPQQLP